MENKPLSSRLVRTEFEDKLPAKASAPRRPIVLPRVRNACDITLPFERARACGGGVPLRLREVRVVLSLASRRMVAMLIAPTERILLSENQVRSRNIRKIGRQMNERNKEFMNDAILIKYDNNLIGFD